MTGTERSTVVVAEIGQAHDGSLGMAHAYVDALAAAGVDAVKFQVHVAEAESSAYEEFRVPFSFEDKTRFDYWARIGFTAAQWLGLKRHCDDRRVEFQASPFSIAAVELLEGIGIRRYKIASGEIDNHLMLDRIAKTGKELWLSSGMSAFRDLDAAIEFLKPYGNRLSIMQCTTAYPTPADQTGLNVIAELRSRYGLPVGYSDHSGSVFAGLAAATLGARMLEVHAVFDRRSFGPDSSSSLTIDEIAQLVQGVRFIGDALAHPIDKNDAERFTTLRQTFGKSLALRVPLERGARIALSNLESKRPAGRGIPAIAFRDVVGRTVNRHMDANEFVNEQDLS